MKDFNSDQLTESFKEILSENYSKESIPAPNIFQLSGFSHYEDVCSNMYAFYLDPDNSHGFKDLFLVSLLEVISSKGVIDFVIDTCKVQREHMTEKGGFIDLLVYEKSGLSDTIQAAIIIENKLRAPLNNDLDDYYDSIHIDPDTNKIGILLTLNPDNPKKYTKKNFINITHKEWITSIKSNLGDYLIFANEKSLIYLKDFIQNIESMSESKEMPESVKFYFENGPQIKELLELKSNLEYRLIDYVSTALVGSDWTKTRSNPGSITITYKKEYLVGYVFYNEIFDKKLFKIDIWIQGKNEISNWRMTDLDSLRKKYPTIHFYDHTKTNVTWFKIASSQYDNLTLNEVKIFGDLVLDKLKNDYSAFAEEVNNILEQA